MAKAADLKVTQNVSMFLCKLPVLLNASNLWDLAMTKDNQYYALFVFIFL